MEVARLEALYEQATPDVPHPVHDRTFFNWRYGVPSWQPNRTYVAERDGQPVAGAVVQTAPSGIGAMTTYVRHVVPLTGSETWLEGVRALLGQIVSDHPDSDVLRLSEPTFPSSLLSAYGFVSDEHFPLSKLQRRKPRLAVKVIDNSGDWSRRLDRETLAVAAGSFWSHKF